MIGTTLKGIEYRLGSGPSKTFETVPTGDQPGPALKTFDMEVALGLAASNATSSSPIPGQRRLPNRLENRSLFANVTLDPQDLCVTATASDALSGQDQTVTQCLVVSAVDQTPPSANCRPRKKWPNHKVRQRRLDSLSLRDKTRAMVVCRVRFATRDRNGSLVPTLSEQPFGIPKVRQVHPVNKRLRQMVLITHWLDQATRT